MRLAAAKEWLWRRAAAGAGVPSAQFRAGPGRRESRLSTPFSISTVRLGLQCLGRPSIERLHEGAAS